MKNLKAPCPITGIEETFQFQFHPHLEVYPFHVEPKKPHIMEQAQIVVFAHSQEHAQQLIEEIYTWFSRKHHNWANYYKRMNNLASENQHRQRALFLKTVMAQANNYKINQIEPKKTPLFVLEN